MFARALIVVLVALNLGVAAWWLLRPEPLPPPVPASSKGGVVLQLLPADAVVTPEAGSTVMAMEGDAADADPAAAPAPASANAAAIEAATTQIPTAESVPSCLRIGPFANRVAAEAAHARLGQSLRDPRLNEEPGKAARYRVLLPPAPDRAQAQATAARIAEAGFKDQFILSNGEEANAIALGAFGNSEAATRHAQALRAAGFPAEVQAQGATGASRWWLFGTSDDPATVRAAFPGTTPTDCAALPGTALR